MAYNTFYSMLQGEEREGEREGVTEFFLAPVFKNGEKSNTRV